MARFAYAYAGAACLAAALLVLPASLFDAVAGDDAFTASVLSKRFPDPDAKADDDAFVGTAACAECHEERHGSLLTSFHAGVLERTDSRGCETCHGPGKEHAETEGDEPLRDPFAADAEELLGLCLRCHAGVLTHDRGSHRAWVFPAGPSGDPRSCTQCHEVHVDREDPAFRRGTGRFRTRAQLAKHAEWIPARRCIECHADFHPQMARSGHANLVTEDKQCGTCHGNGSLHAGSAGRAALILHAPQQHAKDVNEGCLDCHRGGDAVMRWTCAEHARERIRCTTCHDPNAARGKTIRAPEYELCGSCHTDVAASFRLPNGHAVARGRVKCSDCHDPHGNRGRVRDRHVRQRSCARCHAEKTGPFLHDHGIKRTEGCMACHAPHGSPHKRALTHPRIKPLCLQCHPETPHDLAQRRYDNCIRCHTEIHGSDLDRLYRR